MDMFYEEEKQKTRAGNLSGNHLEKTERRG
jgi:hypothetical protein